MEGYVVIESLMKSVQDDIRKMTSSEIDVSWFSPEEIMAMSHKLESYRIDFMMQNDELNRTKQELQAFRDKYSYLYDTDLSELKNMEEVVRLQSEIIMNLAEGVVLVKASDGRIVYANPQFNRIFGYEEGELTGKNISVVNAPSVGDSRDLSPEEFAGQIQSALKNSGNWQGEILNTRKDGSLFWCQATVSTFKHNTYGDVWVATHLDITSRKEAENRLKLLLDASFEGISIAEDGRIVDANKRCAEMFGYTGKKYWVCRCLTLWHRRAVRLS